MITVICLHDSPPHFVCAGMPMAPRFLPILLIWLGFAAISRADKPASEKPWAYTRPRKSALPVVRNGAWARNPIDRFIGSQLENNGLAINTQADRRTLLRRVTFDLTGL